MRPHPLRLLVSAVLVAALATCSSGAGPDRPNILLITLDTTRADHLGCYGYDRRTSPELDALAAESIVYTNAYSVSSWTMPAHASLFTGKFPSAHGAQYDPQGVLALNQGIQGNFGHYRAQPIADGEVTLATLLAASGWSTGGIAGGPWMKKVFRLDRGFQFYDDENISEVNGRSAQDITRVAKEFVDRNAKRPFFLFLNYYDPHGPYQPASMEYVGRVLKPGENPAKMDQTGQLRVAYDAEISYMDEHVGDLFEHLRQKGLYENTWIIVTSDHGELLGEKFLGGGPAMGHGHSLSQAEIHIPLIVKEASADPRRGRNDTPVQQTDVLPTILKHLELPLPPDVQGKPFDVEKRLPIFAEVYPLPSVNPAGRDWRQLGDWRILFDGTYKFGWNSLSQHFLVNLADDPGEEHNLFEADPERSQALEERVKKLVRTFPKPGAASEGDVDAATTKMLEGLGYLGTDEDDG